eukprot:1941444-Amphidinium_carterae.1
MGGSFMKLIDANRLLSYVWLATLVFGPCLPILNLLIAVLASVHSFLLFYAPGFGLDPAERTEMGSTNPPRVGFSGAMCIRKSSDLLRCELTLCIRAVPCGSIAQSLTLESVKKAC